MDVKRYMHPRNKYRKQPDYKRLAIMYPEFRKIAIVDLSGKIKIDFQNKESLRVLTETLLKHDFDLHINIPPNNLNPAITLRMNYILWIEDLMAHLQLPMDKTVGIDIGTGAICIYALLLAKIYGCRIVGTEVDKKSVEYATNCIKRNNLQDMIKVIAVNSNSILKNAVEEDKVYHFSVCNPPFFESGENNSKEKITKALPPRNAPTGNKGELTTEGGELAFISKMFEESIELGDKIKIYTTMIGRKMDLLCLKRLIKSKHVENVTWTEFCQGHTTRWGLAWSFLPKNIIDLTTAPVIRKSGRSMLRSFKEDHKTLITVPMEDKFSCMDDLVHFVKTTTEQLNIKLQDVPVSKRSFDSWICRLTAAERTWEHARRKRRLAQRQIALKNETISENIKTEMDDIESSSFKVPDTEKFCNRSEQTNETPLKETSVMRKENNMENMNGDDSSKEVSAGRLPLFACKLWIQIENSEVDDSISRNIFKIWMVFEYGSGGLEALQSFRQYLMNKLGVTERVANNSLKVAKRKKRKTKR